MADQALQYVPAFALVFFRVAAMLLATPFFASARIPRRVRLMLALVLALGMAPACPQPRIPDSTLALAVGIGGEILFGLALGTAVSLTFVAVHWAGDIMGQQMGINLGEVFDPAMGQGGSVIGDAYFLLSLVIFLSLPVMGHHALLTGLAESFRALPLLSVGPDARVLALLVGLVQAAAVLAIRLAAPMLLTMLVVDLILGFVGKTMPQLNLMSAGLSLRSVVGLVVLAVGVWMAGSVVKFALRDGINEIGPVMGGAAPLISF